MLQFRMEALHEALFTHVLNVVVTIRVLLDCVAFVFVDCVSFLATVMCLPFKLLLRDE